MSSKFRCESCEVLAEIELVSTEKDTDTAGFIHTFECEYCELTGTVRSEEEVLSVPLNDSVTVEGGVFRTAPEHIGRVDEYPVLYRENYSFDCGEERLRHAIFDNDILGGWDSERTYICTCEAEYHDKEGLTNHLRAVYNNRGENAVQ